MLIIRFLFVAHGVYTYAQWPGFLFQLVNPHNKDIRDIPGLAPPAMNRRLLWTPNWRIWMNHLMIFQDCLPPHWIEEFLLLIPWGPVGYPCWRTGVVLQLDFYFRTVLVHPLRVFQNFPCANLPVVIISLNSISIMRSVRFRFKTEDILYP